MGWAPHQTGWGWRGTSWGALQNLGMERAGGMVSSMPPLMCLRAEQRKVQRNDMDGGLGAEEMNALLFCGPSSFISSSFPYPGIKPW